MRAPLVASILCSCASQRLDFSSLKRPLEKYLKDVVRGARHRSIHHYCIRPGHLVGTHRGLLQFADPFPTSRGRSPRAGPALLLLPQEKTIVSSATNV
jgi:hypothetical protein